VIDDCKNLDAFLVGDLSGDATARFAEHLKSCTECREAVDEQQWIDSLLRSDESAALEPAPTSLRETLRTSVVQRRRSARFVAAGFAAVAAAIVLAVGWTVTTVRQENDSAAQNGGIVANQDPAGQPPVQLSDTTEAQRPQATFVSSGDAIAVPVASVDDNVTVVNLYPTTQTERRWRRELVFQSIDSEPNGG
jgi:hypothetical protein